MENCNHVWRVDGEELLNMPLDERVKLISEDQYVWLRKGESSKGYQLCPLCKQAVKLKEGKNG